MPPLPEEPEPSLHPDIVRILSQTLGGLRRRPSRHHRHAFTGVIVRRGHRPRRDASVASRAGDSEIASAAPFDDVGAVPERGHNVGGAVSRKRSPAKCGVCVCFSTLEQGARIICTRVSWVTMRPTGEPRLVPVGPDSRQERYAQLREEWSPALAARICLGAVVREITAWLPAYAGSTVCHPDGPRDRVPRAPENLEDPQCCDPSRSGFRPGSMSGEHFPGHSDAVHPVKPLRRTAAIVCSGSTCGLADASASGWGRV